MIIFELYLIITKQIQTSDFIHANLSNTLFYYTHCLMIRKYPQPKKFLSRIMN